MSSYAPILPSPPSVRATPSPKAPLHRTASAQPSLPLPPSSNGLDSDPPPSHCLLVPTDRPIEELQDKWLHRLENLQVIKEVVLYGYALYGLRSWCLSRTHWSQSIVTQTGKPNEHVSFYLLAPDGETSDRQAAAIISSATQVLVAETHGVPRKTEYGTLVVTSPSTFGQDVFPVPEGDLRLAKPYLMMTTDLRRLGCGGRAAMGMEPPVPAVRRKFIDLYRLPAPPTISLFQSSSPASSPSRNKSSVSPSQLSPVVDSDYDITSDPFTHMVLDLVRLIQGALLLWGMVSDDLEIDGYFCDETKKGMFSWRKIMGLEHEESMRLEKETSGGCIDPKTLATLLSSITSTRFQLEALDVERLPKDPLSNTVKFLRAWRQYQASLQLRGPPARFLTVPSVRALCVRYLDERTRPQDALNVHRLLLGVATATSSITANLKGGNLDDTPIRRKDAHHSLRLRINSTSNTGLSLVIPAGEVGPSAPPDVMTSDLEAYTRGILKSREKDWDMMGAKRIAILWGGQDVGRRRFRSPFERGVLRRKDDSPDEDDEYDRPRGTLGKVTTITGQAIKDGLGAVRRKATVDDSSDSEGGIPHSASFKTVLAKRKHALPTVVAPSDAESLHGPLNGHSASPSASVSRLHVDRPYGATVSRTSGVSATSHGRPSIITSVSNELSDGNPGRSRGRSSSTFAGASKGNANGYESLPKNVNDRSPARRYRGRDAALLSTCSDGADVSMDEDGMEWAVVEPRGTLKGRRHQESKQPRVRRHSLQGRNMYQDMRVLPVDNLEIDVGLCGVYLELRDKEKILRRKVAEVQLFEQSILKGVQVVAKTAQARRVQINQLQAEGETVRKDLRKVVDEMDEDELIQWASKKIEFYLSEETDLGDVVWNLRDLEREYEIVRLKVKEQKENEDKEAVGMWESVKSKVKTKVKTKRDQWFGSASGSGSASASKSE